MKHIIDIQYNNHSHAYIATNADIEQVIVFIERFMNMTKAMTLNPYRMVIAAQRTGAFMGDTNGFAFTLDNDIMQTHASDDTLHIHIDLDNDTIDLAQVCVNVSDDVVELAGNDPDITATGLHIDSICHLHTNDLHNIKEAISRGNFIMEDEHVYMIY